MEKLYIFHIVVFRTELHFVIFDLFRLCRHREYMARLFTKKKHFISCLVLRKLFLGFVARVGGGEGRNFEVADKPFVTKVLLPV